MRQNIEWLKYIAEVTNVKLQVVKNKLKECLIISNIGKKICLNIEEKKNRIFTAVEFETTSVCNRKCTYCPNYTVERPYGYMEEGLFYKIIDELAEIKFSGRLSPHFYGEPLLDKRVVKFIYYIRNRLPNVFIKLFTNGDLLTYELFVKLLNAGVDVFRIAQHDEKPSNAILTILGKSDNKTQRKHLEYINFYDNDEFLMNRGGLITVRHDVKQVFCDYVSGITIDYEGNMLLCCQDYMSKHKFGNLKTEKIMDVWNKKQYKSIRDKVRCGIWPLDICRTCNGL